MLSRYLNRHCYKVFCSKVFVKLYTSCNCRILGIFAKFSYRQSRTRKITSNILTPRTLPTSIMDANSFLSSNDGITKDDIKCFPSNVENTSQSHEVLEFSEQSCGATSAVQCSEFDSDYIGLDFDIPKIVDNVKMKVKEKREKRKMLQEKLSSSSLSENDTFNLQTLFDEAKLSNDDKRNKKREKKRKSEIFSTNVSDADDFDLRVLFETPNTIKKGKKKAKKIKKHHGGRKIKDDESFGLELLFDESSETKKCQRKGKKRKKYDRILEDSENEVALELNGSDETGTEKVKRKRPNHFVAIRISSPEIQSAVENFQTSLLKEDANLKPALVPLSSLHLTMAVMHLDETTIEMAKSALQKCKVKIMEILKAVHFKLQFVGVGNFRNEVVFVKVQREKYLECAKLINDAITSTFEDDGICMSDKKEWKAHLTLLKLSRKRSLRKKGIKKVLVNEDYYMSWADSYFGEELVKNVYLCSMFEPKEQDGFYKCVETITLTEIDEGQVCESQGNVLQSTIELE